MTGHTGKGRQEKGEGERGKKERAIVLISMPCRWYPGWFGCGILMELAHERVQLKVAFCWMLCQQIKCCQHCYIQMLHCTVKISTSILFSPFLIDSHMFPLPSNRNRCPVFLSILFIQNNKHYFLHSLFSIIVLQVVFYPSEPGKRLTEEDVYVPGQNASCKKSG